MIVFFTSLVISYVCVGSHSVAFERTFVTGRTKGCRDVKSLSKLQRLEQFRCAGIYESPSPCHHLESSSPDKELRHNDSVQSNFVLPSLNQFFGHRPCTFFRRSDTRSAYLATYSFDDDCINLLPVLARCFPCGWGFPFRSS